MTVLYVASDRPHAGKTAVCVTLAHLFKESGDEVSVIKPLVPADRVDADTDSEIYRSLLGQASGGPPIALTSDGLTNGLVEEVKGLVDEAGKESGLAIVEGPAGLSPEDSGRLAEAMGAKALVVVDYRADLEVAALTAWSDSLADKNLGFLFNNRPQYLGTDAGERLLPTLESQGLKGMGVLPEDRRLRAIGVEAVAEHLGGRFVVGNGHSERLVEHYLVGGFLMDSGELYFGIRENKAVIMRGDRPDLQMAALKTPTTCMILTKGIEPIEYVVNEAELEGVPVMVVDSDTTSTMERLGNVLDLARFDHPLKLERFAKLMRAGVDVDALRAQLEPA